MIRRVLQPNLHRRTLAMKTAGGFIVAGFPQAKAAIINPLPAAQPKAKPKRGS